MTTYIMLANWTAQGAAKAKDSPARLDAAKADWQSGRMPLPTDDDHEFIPLP